MENDILPPVRSVDLGVAVGQRGHQLSKVAAVSGPRDEDDVRPHDVFGQQAAATSASAAASQRTCHASAW